MFLIFFIDNIFIFSIIVLVLYIKDFMNIKKIQSRLSFADDIAVKSKDKSTKVGAVFHDEYESYPLTFGYNGMPRGLNDNHPERNERPEKYLWTEHAERNALYNLAFNYLETSVAVMTHFPTMEDARAIVSSGIKKVIYNEKNTTNDQEVLNRVLTLFSETKTIIEPIFFSEKNLSTLKKQNFLQITESFAKSESVEYGLNEKEIRGVMIFKDDKSFRPLTAGVYGPPSNLKLNETIVNDKKTWYQDEVKNAIFNLIRKDLKNSVGTVTWCPCCTCTLAIISVGSKKIITRKPNFNLEADLRWKDAFELSQNMLEQTNILLEFIEDYNLTPIKKPKGGM
jgi:dCMP deaminase